MSATLTTERLNEMLADAAKATPGPWERDECENRDDRGRFTSYAVAATPSWSDHPRHVVDTLNSGVMEVQTEHDDNGSSSWDEQGSADVRHIANCDPQTITALITGYMEREAELVALREKVLREAFVAVKTALSMPQPTSSPQFVNGHRLANKRALDAIEALSSPVDEVKS